MAEHAWRELNSAANPWLQNLRRLVRDATNYRRTGELWLEGEHLVEAWHLAGRPIKALLIGASRAESSLAREVARVAAETVLVPDRLFAQMSGVESPTGIGIVAAMPVAPAPKPDLPTVVLDRVQDPGNVGTVLRTAAAMGFAQVLALSGTAALWSPKVLRGGMGAHLTLHLVEGLAPGALGDLSVPLVATLPDAAQSLWEAHLPWPMAWVLGHEGQGVCAEVQALCKLAVRIPQPGGQESLNAAVALGMCLYESARRRAN